MKKILIVDDNQNNRILLRAILEEYAEEEGAEFQIDEAGNGIEAVQQSGFHPYDLILMDIMMPEMDGIEATKRIREADSKVLIVAVSAVDDAERQKEILRNGAEDYISKPINVDIFSARIGNYFALIEARRHKPQSREAHNLYSREIYSRRLTFFIESDDDLAEFWEYYLLNPQMGSALLSDTVRTLYAIGSIALKFSLKLPIWIEESPDFIYFTIEGLGTLDPKFIKLVLAKNPGITDYKFDEGRFSIRVASNHVQEERAPLNEPKSVVTPEPPSQTPAAPQAAAVETAVEFSVTNESENQVFDYMDEEDMGEIRVYIAKLNSLLLVVGSGDVNADEVDEIATYIDRIGKIASIYAESYAIGRALVDLSAEIRGHMQGFIDKSGSLGSMCAAFSRDLMSWLRLIFEEGAPNVNYMDDTIIANAQTIGGMLKMDDTANEAADLDDIFDF
jgi:CheY-like chemotaxis protein